MAETSAKMANPLQFILPGSAVTPETEEPAAIHNTGTRKPCSQPTFAESYCLPALPGLRPPSPNAFLRDWMRNDGKCVLWLHIKNADGIWGGKGWGLFLMQRHPNGSHNPFHIGHHLVVPKPDDPITLGSRIGGSLVIALFLIQVLASVELDHQMLARRAEVSHIRADRVLPTKVNTLLTQRAQIHPQPSLRSRHFLAEFPGAVKDSWAGSSRWHKQSTPGFQELLPTRGISTVKHIRRLDSNTSCRAPTGDLRA
jgi:hypothetical protein